MGFYVGQEVVCIDDSNTELVKKGAIYKVEALGPCPPIVMFEGHIALEGICSGESWRGMDSRRFRPLISRPTNISIFTAMLGPRQKETADGR